MAKREGKGIDEKVQKNICKLACMLSYLRSKFRMVQVVMLLAMCILFRYKFVSIHSFIFLVSAS